MCVGVRERSNCYFFGRPRREGRRGWWSRGCILILFQRESNIYVLVDDEMKLKLVCIVFLSGRKRE
jgi:hypothetical protein